jgi:hypothetical protein
MAHQATLWPLLASCLQTYFCLYSFALVNFGMDTVKSLKPFKTMSYMYVAFKFIKTHSFVMLGRGMGIHLPFGQLQYQSLLISDASAQSRSSY